MNENGNPLEPTYRSTSLCFAKCEDIAFSLMTTAKDSNQKKLFEKLYESFKYSDKVSDDSPLEVDILNKITGFSKALAEGQYDRIGYEELESKINEFIGDIVIRNKRLLESKRGAY